MMRIIEIYIAVAAIATRGLPLYQATSNYYSLRHLKTHFSLCERNPFFTTLLFFSIFFLHSIFTWQLKKKLFWKYNFLPVELQLNLINLCSSAVHSFIPTLTIPSHQSLSVPIPLSSYFDRAEPKFSKNVRFFSSWWGRENEMRKIKTLFTLFILFLQSRKNNSICNLF